MRDEFDSGKALAKENIQEDDLESLVIQQIEFCNMVLLNKASEISKEELGTVRSIVRNLNPKAVIYECDYGNIELSKILNTNLFDFDKVATSAAWINAIEGDEDVAEEGGEVEEYGIGTYVYYRRPALDINKFDNFVAKHWPKNVIRAKGICYFSDAKDKCYLFEQAGSQKSIKDAGQWFAEMPEDQLEEMMRRDKNLRRDWDPEYGDKMIKIVFIGQHLDRSEIDRLMDACLEES
jgi:G3E family GTPase